MARRVTVGVHIERVLDEYGAWCNDCQLPSGVRSWFAVGYMLQMHLKPELWCLDCGGRNVVDGDQPVA